ADGAVELLALGGVLRGDAQRLLARAGDDRADPDDRVLDRVPQRGTALGELTDAVLVPDQRAVEVHHELRLVVGDVLALERDRRLLRVDEEQTDVVADAG